MPVLICLYIQLKVWLELSDFVMSDTDSNNAGNHSCNSLGETDILVEEYGLDQCFLEALLVSILNIRFVDIGIKLESQTK